MAFQNHQKSDFACPVAPKSGNFWEMVGGNSPFLAGHEGTVATKLSGSYLLSEEMTYQ